jgi:hypothetical protein
MVNSTVIVRAGGVPATPPTSLPESDDDRVVFPRGDIEVNVKGISRSAEVAQAGAEGCAGPL